VKKNAPSGERDAVTGLCVDGAVLRAAAVAVAAASLVVGQGSGKQVTLADSSDSGDDDELAARAGAHARTRTRAHSGSFSEGLGRAGGAGGTVGGSGDGGGGSPQGSSPAPLGSGFLSRTGIAMSSSPSLLSGMSAPAEANVPQAADARSPDLINNGRDKLPRTLSTSVLRIKHRATFWDRLLQERTRRDV